jgi:probable HAF family extracellular repeat protein
MKSAKRMCITVMALLTLLAMPLRFAAQDNRNNNPKHQHYQLIDLGTLGGPQSGEALGRVLNNKGTVVGCADTSAPNPEYPNFNPFLGTPWALPDPYLSHAFEWQRGEMTDLGALPGVNNSCESFITDKGLTVGGSENGLIDPLTGWPAMEGVVWKDGRVINLGTFGGNESFAIWANNRGQVVGAAADSTPDPLSIFFGWGTETRAFLWQEGVKQDLGTLGGPDALATMINDHGQIFGASYINSIPNQTTGIPTFDAFLWESGTMLDIPNDFGGTETNPFFANNRGQLVGSASLPGDTIFHPFLFGKGGFTDLGTFGGDNGEADWINDEGQVAGSADFPGDQIHHGALWSNRVMTDLGPAASDPCSRALSINSKAQVVGGSSDCQKFLHATLWQNGQAIDLNTRIRSGSGLQLTVAVDINDRGEISGNATLSNGDTHAFLLIPCDENRPGKKGCDYRSAAAPLVSPAPATQPPAALPPGSHMPVGMLNRFRSRWSQRNAGSGAVLAPDQKKEPPADIATNVGESTISSIRRGAATTTKD